MTGKAEKFRECPEFAELSAFFDGELPADSTAARHIGSCAACQSKVRFMAAADNALKRKYQGKAPESLVAGIVNRIHAVRLMPAARSGISFIAYFIHAAALLVIGAGIFGIVIYSVGANKEKSAVQPLAETLKTTNDRDVYPYYTSSGIDLIPQYSIPIQNLTAVDYGNVDNPVFIPPLAEKPANLNPAPIAPFTRQVWIVKNLAETEKTVRGILKKNLIPESDFALTAAPRSIKLVVRLNKLQLINLVRAGKENGFDLVSPEQPQPEQNCFYGKAADEVKYEADFVLNKDS